jgi:hypothetical protein
MTPPPPDAAVNAEELEACKARCDRIVMSRHDACGRNGGHPYPAWCAESNFRMSSECESACD